jgi:hypothetical protein
MRGLSDNGYEDDDQTILPIYQRELVGEGLSNASIQKHKPDLRRNLRGPRGGAFAKN